MNAKKGTKTKKLLESTLDMESLSLSRENGGFESLKKAVEK